MARVKVTWTRSGINRKVEHKRTIKALGLRRLHHSVEHELTPQIKGMINAVHHMVRVEEVDK